MSCHPSLDPQGGPCGRVVSVSLDHTLQVYDLLASSSALCSVRCPSGLSCVAADAAERRLFLGSTQGSIFLVRGTDTRIHTHTHAGSERDPTLHRL